VACPRKTKRRRSKKAGRKRGRKESPDTAPSSIGGRRTVVQKSPEVRNDCDWPLNWEEKSTVETTTRSRRHALKRRRGTEKKRTGSFGRERVKICLDSGRTENTFKAETMENLWDRERCERTTGSFANSQKGQLKKRREKIAVRGKRKQPRHCLGQGEKKRLPMETNAKGRKG